MKLSKVQKIIEGAPVQPFLWVDSPNESFLAGASDRHLREEVKLFYNPKTKKWYSKTRQVIPWQDQHRTTEWIDHEDEDDADTREDLKKSTEDWLKECLFEDLRALICMNLQFKTDESNY